MALELVARQKLCINRSNPINDYDTLRSNLNIPRAWQDPHLPLNVSNLPALPLILDPDLRKQAVTHQTVFTSTLSRDPLLMREKIDKFSYEPLEVLGDRYLATCGILALRRYIPNLGASQMVVSFFYPISVLLQLS